MKLATGVPTPGFSARGAFTLIELLVVVAIIALLISILLPSLNGARRSAKRAVCSANQRQIGIASRAYGDENEDWIVGAPNGSGFAAYAPGSIFTYRGVPSTIWDWANPLRARYLGDSTVDMNDVLSRMRQTREGIFRCPETKHVMFPFRGVPPSYPADKKIQREASYLTSYKFMLVGNGYYRPGTTQPRHQGQAYNGSTYTDVVWYVQPNGWETTPPSDYRPVFSRVGPNDRKVFLMDGSRYVVNDTYIDYDATRDAVGSGSYSGSGSLYRGSIEYGVASNGTPLPGQKFSYRHGSGPQRGVNALFFDGHVQALSEKQTRHHGYFTVSGSKLTVPGDLHPTTLANLTGFNVGDALPD